ncbi:MAG: hypothetical protein ACK6CU_12810 [Deltaproteobacteria bacterium]|jgi:hypothetical protein
MRSASWCFRLSMVLVAWSMVLGVERASAQTAAAARAPGPSPELLATRRRLLREPTPRQTVEAALRYFRVHPEAVDGLRAAARARGSVPLIAGGYRYDQAETGRSFEQQMFQPNTQTEATGARTHSVTAGAIWDLREMVFNPAEVQVYGVVGVQRDVILEITRTFFMRRQLVIRAMMRPPEDEVARLTLQLRIEELTSLLDVMTGGWFGEALERSDDDEETTP